MNNTLTLGKRPHSYATVLETPGSGWDILSGGPEPTPEVTPESPDFVQSGVSGVGRPESPVLLGQDWSGSVRWEVRRLVRRLVGVSGLTFLQRSENGSWRGCL